MFARKNGALGFGMALGLAALSPGCADYNPGNRLVYAEGTTVHLARLEGGKLVEITSASVPAEGQLDGHTIFGLMKHPREPWLYVSSFNDCNLGDFWCWGNARIDRFEVGGSHLAHAGTAFSYDLTVAVVALCAGEDTSDYPGQVGFCAPVNGGFSADGSRLYMKEDDLDVLDTFAVGEDGALTLLWQGEEDEIRLHGIAKHPTEPYLYNGTQVLDVSGDRSLVETPGTGGNYTALVGTDLLLTTLGTDTVALYSLADPAVPALVDSAVLLANQARSVDIDPGRGRLVAVGRDRITTFTFDGESLTESDALAYGGTEFAELRSVAMLEGGDRAVAAWFMVSSASPSGYVGGVTVYEIGPDGTLTERDTVPTPQAARVVITLAD